MTDKKNDVPSEEGQTEPKPSGGVSPDSGDKPTDEAPLEVPKHLEGKKVKELIEMQKNLEKKLGEQSSEVKEARETKKNVEVLLGAIYADPKRYKEASAWIKSYLGGETQAKAEPSEVGEEAKTGTQPVKVDDTRRALQNQIFADFYKRRGLDKLSAEERKGEQTKIATAFAELIDPGGTKSTNQLLDEVPLDRLPKYLESAYILANTERIAKEAGQKGLLAAEEKRQASIGTLPSSSGKGEKVTLTPAEQAVAKKMGVKPEDYAKEKVIIEKESKKL